MAGGGGGGEGKGGITCMFECRSLIAMMFNCIQLHEESLHVQTSMHLQSNTIQFSDTSGFRGK